MMLQPADHCLAEVLRHGQLAEGRDHGPGYQGGGVAEVEISARGGL